MKILESQNAVLTNYEVFQFILDRRAQMAREKPPRRRGPNNLDTLIRELLQYLKTPPGPLSQEPLTYEYAAIPRLVERLNPYELSKGELIMIINLRPATPAALHACVEEIEERFTEDQQLEILDVIAQELGQFPAKPEDAEAGDEAQDPNPVPSVENGAS